MNKGVNFSHSYHHQRNTASDMIEKEQGREYLVSSDVFKYVVCEENHSKISGLPEQSQCFCWLSWERRADGGDCRRLGKNPTFAYLKNREKKEIESQTELF